MKIDLERAKKLYLDTLIQSQVVKFGLFETKSGRISPYFFNLGNINQGPHVHQLSQAYSDYFKHYFKSSEQIFGPAYKGIPIVSTLACAAWSRHQQVLNFSYNRKEVKHHGEGGNLVGGIDKSKPIVIVEDVLTGGVSIHETIENLLQQDIQVEGCLIGVDRCEKNYIDSSRSSSNYLSVNYKIPVVSITTIFEVIDAYEKQQGSLSVDQKKLVADYQSRYCLLHA